MCLIALIMRHGDPFNRVVSSFNITFLRIAFGSGVVSMGLFLVLCTEYFLGEKSKSKPWGMNPPDPLFFFNNSKKINKKNK
ncbi:MAG: hypothetical protein H7839_06000 [Magnetococcus sp. YQC-5]